MSTELHCSYSWCVPTVPALGSGSLSQRSPKQQCRNCRVTCGCHIHWTNSWGCWLESHWCGATARWRLRCLKGGTLTHLEWLPQSRSLLGSLTNSENLWQESTRWCIKPVQGGQCSVSWHVFYGAHVWFCILDKNSFEHKQYEGF